jgi:hypothetical protein
LSHKACFRHQLLVVELELRCVIEFETQGDTISLGVYRVH